LNLEPSFNWAKLDYTLLLTAFESSLILAVFSLVFGVYILSMFDNMVPFIQQSYL